MGLDLFHVVERKIFVAALAILAAHSPKLSDCIVRGHDEQEREHPVILKIKKKYYYATFRY